MFDVRFLLAVDCSVFNVDLKGLKIQPNSLGCGAFSGRPVGAREIVGYYYETEMYIKLTTQKWV